MARRTMAETGMASARATACNRRYSAVSSRKKPIFSRTFLMEVRSALVVMRANLGVALYVVKRYFTSALDVLGRRGTLRQ